MTQGQGCADRLLLQTPFHHCRLHLNFPLHYVKVFSPLVMLILMYTFTLNCDRLSPSSFSFISSLDSMSIPKSTSEAMADHNWQQTMLAEMAALDANNTWELVPIPPNSWT